MFGVEPDLTREGGSIPVTLTLQETTGKNVMLLPIGACDDGAHSQNEKIDRVNYIEGVSALLNLTPCSLLYKYSYIFFVSFQTKVMAAYFDEVSKL